MITRDERVRSCNRSSKPTFLMTFLDDDRHVHVTVPQMLVILHLQMRGILG